MPSVIKKIWYLLPEGDSIKLAILFSGMLFASLLEVVGIGMIPAFVSIVAAPDSALKYEPLQGVYNFLDISSSQDLLFWGAAGLVGVFILKGLYIIVFHYYEAKYLNNRQYKVSTKLMTSYMLAPYTFHLQRNTAELLRNITKEVNNVIGSVMTNIVKMTMECMMTISILLFLLFMEPMITLIVILLSGLGSGTFIFMTRKKVKQYGIEQMGHRRSMIKAVNQGIGGIKEARVLNREKELIERYRIEAFKSSRLSIYISYIQQIPKPVVEATAVLGMMLISALMVWQGRPMGAIIPILSLFAMATVRLMPSVQQLSKIYTTLKFNVVSVDPVFEDIKELEEYTRNLADDRKKEKLVLRNKIQFNDVSYSYPNSNEQALRGVSFVIPRGSAIAFVGASGAGKTTVVDLVLGLLEPTDGIISVDGKNINESLSSWQRNIGYIPQSIYIADETLRNNVAFGLAEKDIDDDKIWNALKLAQLKSLVETLPEGLDTILGENGTRLSGGQRQRIGIARALYEDPEVLVMDEATSALDNITEKQITKAIENLKGDRTIIMIAHRLTTVQNCDSLYLMKDGKIVDSGNYQALVENNIEFKKMALVDG